ncbi:MAG: ATP-dependent helicase [Burkholderiaceae bacterium]|nr:ATP-dependent helicase [Microbacteriaceae bacterium]
MSVRGFQRATVAAVPGVAGVVLDPSQRAVVDLADTASAAIIGAPGSGKTTTVVELIADRVLGRGWAPEQILALTPSRATATALRDVLALRLGVPTNGPLARSVNSLAFEIAGGAAVRTSAGGVSGAGAGGLRLITGGEQDSDMGQVLAGHTIDGRGPAWPPTLGAEVRALRGFRTELRELLMRATEYNVAPEELRSLGDRLGHPEWRAAADFFVEYQQVSGWLRPGQCDSAELMQLAASALNSDRVAERISGLRLVVVDDLQEATESTLVLLRALAGRRIAVIAVGDPDVAANAFRGGEPDALGRLSTVLGLPGLPTLYLDIVHRQGPQLRALTSAVVGRIGTAAAGRQRSAGVVGARAGSLEPAPLEPIIRIEAATSSRELGAIARVLRERSLVDRIGFGAMAVVVRSGAQVPVVARALALADVPTRSSVGGAPLRDDLAARALLRVVDLGMGRTPTTADSAVDLLSGPFGGLDMLGLRRLRLALRAEELAGGGTRSSGELLVDALAAPGRLATIDHRVARHADRIAATLAAVRELAATGTIEELLWLAWERSRLAPAWLDAALGAGITAAEANRNLDGIVALFTAARRFVERQPATPASVFLDAVLDAEVPEDTLSPQSSDDAVLVTTPSGVVGLEFEVVVVAGVQEGIWPNLKLRGSLLNAHRLVEAVTGIDGATLDPRKQVLGDELRMFALAVSRARSQVVVTAVASDDEAPSVFFSFLPPDVPVTDSSALPPLSLRGFTGRLRRELVHPNRTDGERSAAASSLAVLAAEGVPGAGPEDWLGLEPPSSLDPLYLADETVPVSPSALGAFEESPLDWFVNSIAGSTGSTRMHVGTIVHWAMETSTDTSVDGLVAAIESRWDELFFESRWMSEHERHATRRLAVGLSEYLADFHRDGKSLVAAEGRFALSIGRATVNGSIDRVERAADGSVVIVDLKTGAPVTRRDLIDGHPQLGAYQLAYADGMLDEQLDGLGGHSGGGAKLLFVKSGVGGKTYRVAEQAALDVDALDAVRRRISDAAELMASTEFDGTVEVTGWGAQGSARLHRVRAVTSD